MVGGLSLAEIKSTLDLAMEKTKKIAISKEEREEIKQKELLQNVNRLFHRYREGRLHLNELLRETGKMDEKTRSMAKEILLSQWIDALSLTDKEERLFEGIESLKERSVDEVKQKFNDLLFDYQEEKEKIKQKEKARMEEVLGREGIHGSAVEPNIEGSQHLKEELSNLNHLYEVKLKEIKERLRTL
jgi:hypothetical protein